MKRLSDQTLYEIIEVSVDAPPEEIERACLRASAAYGPGSLATYTLAAPEETALLSSRIEEARAVLLDPGARARYDERIGVRPAIPPLQPEPARRSPSEAIPLPQGTPAPWPPPGPEPATPDLRHVSPGLPAAFAPPPGIAPAPSAPQPSPRSAPLGVSPEAPPPSPPASIPSGPPAAPAPPIALVRPVAPILLEREVAAPSEPVMPEGGAWTGEMLRRVRESRGLTVQQLAERTRVTRHHLENIEREKLDALPAAVYLRGIIMSLARELRLDGQKVARSYMERTGSRAEVEPRRPS